MLPSGARGKDLPERLPSPCTCWRRHREWTEAGTLEKAWARLLLKLDRRGRLRWDEGFADATFVPAKKGVKGSA